MRGGPTHLTLDRSILPSLQHLICDHRLAVNLIPGRPISTFVARATVKPQDMLRVFIPEPNELLSALRQSTARVKWLQIIISYASQPFLRLISSTLLHLER